MTVATKNDDALQLLLDNQEEMEQQVREAGELLKSYVAKTRDIQKRLGGDGGSATPRQGTTTTTNGRKKADKAAEATTSKGKAKAKAAKAVKSGDDSDQGSLKDAILKVLTRPAHKKGLKVGQIAEIIESEGIWKTDGDLNNQMQSNIWAMKKKGLVERDNDTNLYRVP